jgi:hypothetical protein
MTTEPKQDTPTSRYIGSGLYAEFGNDSLLRIYVDIEVPIRAVCLSPSTVDALLAYIAEARP